MKNQLLSGRFADEMNFKRPCWLALFASLGMLLVGYNAYYGMFPYGQAGQVEALNTWQMLREKGLFLLMVAGAFGFMASLTWWFVAAIEFHRPGSHPRSAVALSALSPVGPGGPSGSVVSVAPVALVPLPGLSLSSKSA